MADATMELLRELTEAPGISGYEQEVREIIRRHLQDITTIEQDRLGSIVVAVPTRHIHSHAGIIYPVRKPRCLPH